MKIFTIHITDKEFHLPIYSELSEIKKKSTENVKRHAYNTNGVYMYGNV